MAKPTKAPAPDAAHARISILIPVDDARWVDGEAARLSLAERYGRKLTRSDVIRGLIHDAATATTK